MKKIFAAMSIIMLLLAAQPSAGAAEAGKFIPTVPILPLSQLKPGMKGEAHTVKLGTKITTFRFTVLGVIPRKTSPKNLILFRIDDKETVEEGGVAAGMSGSPLYVGGRLIGALGYSWSFADRSLGLATPIEEMAKALEWPDKLPEFGVAPITPQEPMSADVKPASEDAEVTSGDEADFVISRDEAVSQDAVSKDVIISADVSMDAALLSTAQLRPLAMPLLVDGISPRIAGALESRLGATLIPLGSSQPSGQAANLKARPEPGAAIGVALAWGDMQMGGIGTLSAVDKEGRFLAFAHPMMNYGAVAFPLTDAEIIKIIPSSEHSFKLGNMGKIIGIVTQDRPEAIAGRVGRLAPANSYTVKMTDIDAGRSYTKRFQTVADSFVGPELGSLGMLGIVDDLWARTGEGTAILKYRFSGGNLTQGWERRNMFFSEKDLISVLLKEFDTLSKIFALNQFQEIRPFGVELEVEITRSPRVVFIEKLEIADKKEFYAPGDKVELDVTMRPWRKRAVVKKFTLTVPENAVGFCEVVVRAGGIAEPEQESIITGLRAITNLDGLLKELSTAETNNQIIAEIDGPETSKKKKDAKEDLPDIEDLMDDRLQSEIREERLKKNAMVIVDTNYFADGLLRKLIKVKRADGDESAEAPTPEGEAEMRKEAESMERDEEAGETPPSSAYRKIIFSERE